MEEPINILCVDDEKNVLRSLKRVFLDDGYEIHAVQGVEEGIATLKSVSPIQIVISDYRMPGTNGVEFLRIVCENWPDTVRIVLSGYADMAAVISAVNEGEIYKFIPKPWNEDEIRIAVSNALERYFLRKKNAELASELKNKNDELQEINQNQERIIKDRTAELILQNSVLTYSQNILDSLPVGVLGIDADGLVAQCNRQATKLLTAEASSVIGREVSDLIPEKLSSVVRCVRAWGSCSERIQVRGVSLTVQGVFVEHVDGQEGVVLVLLREGRGAWLSLADHIWRREITPILPEDAD